MWISREMTQREPQGTASADFGVVTVGGEYAGVLSAGETRGIPVAAPGGYAWRPAAGQNVLVIKGGPLGDQPCLLGKVQETPPVELGEGEVCLYAPGGASLTLRADGSVELRGTLFINGERYVPRSEEE